MEMHEFKKEFMKMWYIGFPSSKIEFIDKNEFGRQYQLVRLSAIVGGERFSDTLSLVGRERNMDTISFFYSEFAKIYSKWLNIVKEEVEKW